MFYMISIIVYVISLISLGYADEGPQIQGEVKVLPEYGLSLEPMTPIVEKSYTWFQVINMPVKCTKSGASKSLKDSVTTVMDNIGGKVNQLCLQVNEKQTKWNHSSSGKGLDTLCIELQGVVERLNTKSQNLIELSDNNENNHGRLWGLAKEPICGAKPAASNEIEEYYRVLKVNDEGTVEHTKIDPPELDRKKRDLQSQAPTHHGNYFHFNQGSANTLSFHHVPYILPSLVDNTSRFVSEKRMENVPKYTTSPPTPPHLSSNRAGYDAYRRKVKIAMHPTKEDAAEHVNTIDVPVYNFTTELESQHQPFGRSPIFEDNYFEDGIPSQQKYATVKIGKKYQINCIDEKEDLMRCWGNSVRLTSRAKRSTREKRGILDFIGDIDSFLFGTATKKQLAKVNDAVSSVVGLTKLNKKAIDKMSVMLVDTSTYVDDRVTKMMNITQSHLKTLGLEINKTNTIVNNILSSVEDLDEISSYLISLTALLARSLQMEVILDLCRSDLVKTNKRFSAYKSMVENKRLSPDIISVDVADQILRGIKSDLPVGSDIPKGFDVRDWYTISRSAIKVIKGHIIGIVTIPIISVSEEISATKVQSVPYKLGETWVQFPYENHVILSKPGESLWSIIPYSDYLDCYVREYHACPKTIPWRLVGSNQCAEYLIHASFSSTQRCALKVTDVTRDTLPIAKPVWPRSWLLTLAHDKERGEILCPGDENTPSVPQSVELTRQSVVTIETGCTLKVSGLQLKPPYATDITANHNILPITDYAYGTIQLNGLVIKPLGSDIGNVSRMDLQRLVTAGKLNLDFPIGESKLKEKIDEIHRSQTEHDKAYKKAKEITENMTSLIKQELLDGGLNLDFSGFTTLFQIGLSLTTLVAWTSLVMVCVLWFRNNRVMAGAAAISAMPMRGFAATLRNETLIVNVTVSTDPKLTNATVTDFKWLNIDPALYSLIQMVVLMGIMLFVMILLMHCHNQSTRDIMLRQAVNLGVHSQNKAGNHNIGENQIVAYFLVKVTNLTRKGGKIIEVGAQITSIPLQVGDWCLKDSPDVSSWISRNYAYRWNKSINMPLCWGPVCLMTDRFPDIDSCRDMPSNFQMDLCEFLGPYRQLLPTTWYKIEIIGVSKIILRWNNVTKDLYNYTE